MDPIEQMLSRLHHPTLASIDMKLDRMHRLLMMLGSPHKKCPSVIHVAGTNGKGSLIAYLQAIFQAAGYRVHAYTSPHLVQFRERIILDGKMIENAQVQQIASYVVRALAEQPATFFEATTAIAFLAFAQKPADILLLETGMGGRLDATNVIDKPLLTAITPISFDHTDFLGDTLTKIATEKAGIMKKGVPCVVGRQQPEAMMLLKQKAELLQVPLSVLGEDWDISSGSYVKGTEKIELQPSLVGVHQFDNAATAVACIRQLPQFTISDEHIRHGVASAKWAARLQKLEQNKYQAYLPDDVELWLDGGHNAQGGEILARFLASREGIDKYLVCGMVGGKDGRGFLVPLAPHVKGLQAVAIPGESTSAKPEKVADSAKAVGIDAQVAENIEKSLQAIAAQAKKPYMVCICGSLYLAGKILA